MLTFDLFFGITHSFPGADNEKGIRFNAGAVPAAVCLSKNFLIFMPLFVVRLWEGNQKEGEPEYLPRFTIILFAFGDNSKNELQFIVIHFLYSKESRQIKT